MVTGDGCHHMCSFGKIVMVWLWVSEQCYGKAKKLKKNKTRQLIFLGCGQDFKKISGQDVD